MRPQAPTLLAALLVACGSSDDDAPADTDAASSSTGVLTDDGAGPSSGVADSTGPGPGTDTEPTASTGGTMDTGDTGGGCTGPEQCDDPDLPFCEMGACVPCSSTPDPDASCLALDPATPVCTDTKCSPCSDDPSVCTGPTPICADSGECVPCNAHDQCPAMAGCDLLVGECLPADAVYYVDNSGACPGDGSEATPFCSFTDAINAIGANNAGTIRIATASGYDADLVIGGAQTIALLGMGAGQNLPVISGASGGDPNILSVSNAGTTVYADHLRLQGNVGAPAIEVNAATFYGTRLEVVQNSGGGVIVEGNADVRFVNSIISGNGVGGAGQQGITANGGSIDLLYVTVARNDGDADDSLLCTGGATVVARNSILSGRDANSVSCPGADITFCATDEAIAGMGNMQVGATQNMWFQDATGGGFAITPAGDGVFGGIAEWQDGDPLTDIDGDARPGVNGQPDTAGADVLP